MVNWLFVTENVFFFVGCIQIYRAEFYLEPYLDNVSLKLRYFENFIRSGRNRDTRMSQIIFLATKYII